MSRRKRKWHFGYLLLAVILGILGAFLFSTKAGRTFKISPPAATAPSSPQTGYKTEDRQKLEQLIHQGTKHD